MEGLKEEKIKNIKKMKKMKMADKEICQILEISKEELNQLLENKE